MLALYGQGAWTVFPRYEAYKNDTEDNVVPQCFGSSAVIKTLAVLKNDVSLQLTKQSR